MARANNKYTSINFNHILHKDPPSSSSSSTSSSSSSSFSSSSYSSVARSHGRMLVLTRPSPKPLTSPLTTTTTPSLPTTPDQASSESIPNQISLRPLGHTGNVSALSFPVRTQETEKHVPDPPPLSVSLKPDRFVPPHLRPGFVRKDEKPVLDAACARDPNPNPRLPHQEQHHQHQQPRQGYFRSPGRYGQNGRPKSGGYERNRTDQDLLGRPRSSGNRPGTSGWYAIPLDSSCCYSSS